MLHSKVLSGLVSLAVAVALWQLAWFATGGVGFSSIADTLNRLGTIIITSVFWRSLGETLFLAMVGLAIGLVTALVVGVALGANPYIDKATRGTLNFLRSLPSVILLPLFMASIGSFYSIVIYLVAAVVSFKLVVFVIKGVRDTELGLRDAAHVLRLTRAERVTFVLLPSAAVLVATGLRLSATRAYGAVVLAGVIAGTPGIGTQIGFARLSPDAAPVLAYAIVAGALGVLIFYTFSAVEKSVVRWRIPR